VVEWRGSVFNNMSLKGGHFSRDLQEVREEHSRCGQQVQRPWGCSKPRVIEDSERPLWLEQNRCQGERWGWGQTGDRVQEYRWLD